MMTVSKSNKILGLIRRSFKYLDTTILKQLFIALVRPHLEYGNVVWYPQFKKDVDKIEGIQRRATRLLPELKNLDYETRLKILDLPSLVYRRYRGDAIETYKYLHGLYQVNHDGIFCLCASDPVPQVTTRGHSYKLCKKRCNTRSRQQFFGNRIVNLWNSLPEDVVSAPSLNTFKSRLDKHWKKIRFSLDPDVFCIKR